MRIVDVTQRSPAWLRWRAQGVTASKAAVVLGRSPYKTPWRLWPERTGLAREAARDLHVPVGEELDHWSVLAGEYRDLLREKARLDALLKESKEDLGRGEAVLIAMMGGFLAAEAAGLKVTRFLQNGAIDYGKALKALLPDLDATALATYRRKASERVRITALDEKTATIPFDGQAVDAAWQQGRANPSSSECLISEWRPRAGPLAKRRSRPGEGNSSPPWSTSGGRTPVRIFAWGFASSRRNW